MDKRGNVQENVTVPRAHLARNRHAGRAAEDLAHKLAPQPLRPRSAEAIARRADADLRAAVIAVAVATAQVAVK